MGALAASRGGGAFVHRALRRSSADLAGTGAVCAMTLGLIEAAGVVDRRERSVIWGPGCHRRRLQEQQYGIPAQAVREAVWRNSSAIVRETATAGLLPEGIREGRA